MTLPLYLDYAATTPMDARVLDAMLPYFTEFYGNPSSRFHSHGWLAEEAVEKAKEQISKSLGVDNKEIVFTSGATESINLALKGFLECHPEHKLITFETEHKATLDTAAYLSVKNKKVYILPIKPTGEIDLEMLENELKNGLALVSVVYANNETGLISPIYEIGKLVKKYNGILHIDASQAVGKVHINFEKSDIDLMSFSGHKTYGPKGLGVLLVKKGIKLEPQLHGGGHQRGMRSGTLNVPLIVGLGMALEVASQNIEKFNSEIKGLKDAFESQLLKIFPFIKINGSEALRIPNISNVCFQGFDGEALLQKLYKIAISNGSACNSVSILPSHVLKAMGLTDAEAFSSLRFSFGIYSTQADVVFALKHLQEVLE